MRIGIVTLSLGNNYGGILQNYALQQVLKRLGHDPITIDCVPPYTVFRLVLRFCKSCFLWFVPHKRRSFKHYQRRQDILDFLAQYIHKTSTVRCYKSSLIKEYKIDALVVGSDQVWRPSMGRVNIKDRFLQFAENFNIKKIAYAASFGVDKWEYTSKQTAAVKRLVSKLDAVSVREYSGVELCQKYLNITAQWVLDPVFLLNKKDYEYLCESIPVHSPFVLAYILDPNILMTKEIESIVERFNFSVKFVFADAYRTLSIQEWIALFRDAAFVITNSFHGTAFSIIFNKPFFVMPNAKRGLARIHSLLSITQLENRLLQDMKGTDINIQIDWENVNGNIYKKQKESINFLKQWL